MKTSPPDPTTADSIVLIHGLWMTPRSCEHWGARRGRIGGGQAHWGLRARLRDRPDRARLPIARCATRTSGGKRSAPVTHQAVPSSRSLAAESDNGDSHSHVPGPVDPPFPDPGLGDLVALRDRRNRENREPAGRRSWLRNQRPAGRRIQERLSVPAAYDPDQRNVA